MIKDCLQELGSMYIMINIFDSKQGMYILTKRHIWVYISSISGFVLLNVKLKNSSSAVYSPGFPDGIFSKPKSPFGYVLKWFILIFHSQIWIVWYRFGPFGIFCGHLG
jgi:hypothetical protein